MKHSRTPLFALSLLTVMKLSAATYEWTGATNVWGLATNWSPTTAFPSVAGDSANFSANTNSPITMGDARTIGILSLSSSSFVTLDASGSVLFNNTTNNPQINASTNGHIIHSPITLNGSLPLLVNITDSNTLTIDGFINGTSGLIKNGTGTLLIKGFNANTFVGTVNVNEGNLYLNKNPTTAALPKTININGGTLKTFADNQLNTNSIITVNSGLLDISFSQEEPIQHLEWNGGAINFPPVQPLISNFTIKAPLITTNSFSNPIIIETGGNVTLNPGTGAATISAIEFGNSATVNVPKGSQNIDLIFKNSLGTNFTKIGSGTLQLGPGGTHNVVVITINEGVITAPVGTNVTTAILVGSLGTIKGSGAFGNVNLNGTIAPGNSIGTLNVGNIDFNNGSIYECEVSGSASDQIISSGTVTIHPGSLLKIIPLENAGRSFGPFSIITAPTIQHLADFSIQKPNNLFLETVTYNTNNVELSFEILPFTSIFPKGNRNAIAFHLDQNYLSQNTDLKNVINRIELFDYKELAHAFDQIDPSHLKALPLLGQNNAVQVRSSISHRLKELSTKADPCKPRDLTLWATTNADFYSEKALFKTNTSQTSIGVDKVTTNNFLFGLAASYAASKLDVIGNRGNAHIRSGFFNLYGAKFAKNYFAHALVQESINHYNQNRSIVFTDTKEKAHSSCLGHQGLAHISSGYIWSALEDNLEFIPFAAFDLTFQRQQPFTEKGGGAFNVKMKGSWYSMLRSQAGVRLTYRFENPEYKTLFDSGLSFVREERFSGSNYKGALINAKGQFKVTGINPNRNLVVPEISLLFKNPCERVYVRIGYAGEFAKGYRMHSARFKVGSSF